MNKITVIGGGAAGLMAAIAAAKNGAQVSLIEPNERLGKKINITGKGRCNVTNDTDLEGLMAHIPRNGRFLYSALSRFTSRDTMAFFEGCGVPLKVERGDRVFPVSDSAFDITDALKRQVKTLGIRWLHDRAASVETVDGRVTAVTGEKGRYPGRRGDRCHRRHVLSRHRLHGRRLSDCRRAGAYHRGAAGLAGAAGQR